MQLGMHMLEETPTKGNIKEIWRTLRKSVLLWSQERWNNPQISILNIRENAHKAKSLHDQVNQ